MRLTLKRKFYEKFQVLRMLMLAVIAIISWGCNEQPKVNEDLSFNEVFIPTALQTDMKNGRFSSIDVVIEEVDIMVTNENGEEIFGKMRFTIPPGDDNMLIKFEMTNNIFDKTALMPDFWVDYDNNVDTSNGRVMRIGTCLKAYQTGFTDSNGNKIKGRGACKAGCWGQLAIAAATVVVAASAIKIKLLLILYRKVKIY